jgi:hypothetical protein
MRFSRLALWSLAAAAPALAFVVPRPMGVAVQANRLPVPMRATVADKETYEFTVSACEMRRM